MSGPISRSKCHPRHPGLDLLDLGEPAEFIAQFRRTQQPGRLVQGIGAQSGRPLEPRQRSRVRPAPAGFAGRPLELCGDGFVAAGHRAGPMPDRAVGLGGQSGREGGVCPRTAVRGHHLA